MHLHNPMPLSVFAKLVADECVALRARNDMLEKNLAEQRKIVKSFRKQRDEAKKELTELRQRTSFSRLLREMVRIRRLNQDLVTDNHRKDFIIEEMQRKLTQYGKEES